jgi:hypothetical protein
MARIKGSKNRSKSSILDERVEVQAKREPEPEVIDQPFLENPELTEKKKKDRISISVTEEGKLDVESMRSETLAKVRAFFQDEENQKLLGATVGTKPDDIISEKDVDMLFNLVATIEGWGFSLVGKIDADIASRCAQWNEKEKAMVVPPAQRVIAKNAASLQAFLKWKDEIVLGVIFLAISRAKFELARNEQKARNDFKRNGGTITDVNPADFKPFTDQPQ